MTGADRTIAEAEGDTGGGQAIVRTLDRRFVVAAVVAVAVAGYPCTLAG